MFGRCRFHLLHPNLRFLSCAGGWVSGIVACGLSGMFGYSDVCCYLLFVDVSEIPFPTKQPPFGCVINPAVKSLGQTTNLKEHLPSEGV